MRGRFPIIALDRHHLNVKPGASLRYIRKQKGVAMDNDRVEGAAKQAKGAIKETVR
jgi:hypothetical protein